MSQKKEVFQPDDRFFRQAMSDRSVAQKYLQYFYPEIAAIADLESLQQRSSRALRPNLKLFDADIIYRCRFKEEKEKHFHFSLLFEHKSEPEEHTAIQVGLYILLLLHQQSRSGKKRLEPVIPLVFYNGKVDWQPKTIRQLFENSPHFEQLEPYMPNFRFLFKDITKIPPEELLKLDLSYFRSAMLSMALRHQPQLILSYIATILQGIKGEGMESVMTFALAVMERSPKQFMETLENLEFTTKPEVMSTLEMLKEEGRQEGRQEERIIHLLKTAVKFPQLDDNELADFTGLPLDNVQGFRRQLRIGNPASLMRFIEEELLAGMLPEAENRRIMEELAEQLYS
ncbi:MAG: hypothetical protein GVY26_04100 [Bacteroidetes bacterium]|jgi:predicted transposase/invertase (TIGR01784 family)|nr:hypothetical protein [Bacteroidota bacterium]